MKNLFVRFGALLIALFMMFSATACGGNSKEPSGKRPPSKVDEVVNDNVNTKDYDGTEITYATWRNPALYEDGPVVQDFEKKYGIYGNDLKTVYGRT